VLGAGSWGTALAALLARRDHDVTLWSFEEEVARAVNESHTNPYLPGVALPAELRATHDAAGAVREADVVVLVSPSQFVGSVLDGAASHIPQDALVVSASKGIEIATLRRMDEVVRDVLGAEHMRRFCALSGPSFSAEVAREEPTAVVVASEAPEAARQVQALFQTGFFRVYTNADVIGVELAGALKNVIALAAGATSGLGFGHNTLAALITRGLAEITRLGLAVGAERATFSGLAGMGDLVLTCTGALSRNRTVGQRLGRGERLDAILSEMKAVAEGVKTVEAAHALAARHGVEMPITEQVYRIIHDGRAPADALRALMLRDPKPEEWS
jgi:glycerol-3-phosphate dehydrogenase (NAD(P)+)